MIHQGVIGMKRLVNFIAICVLAWLSAYGISHLGKRCVFKVRRSAVWAGGADGGAYVRCSVDAKRDVDLCEVWNDYTGYSAGPRDYQWKRSPRSRTLN